MATIASKSCESAHLCAQCTRNRDGSYFPSVLGRLKSDQPHKLLAFGVPCLGHPGERNSIRISQSRPILRRGDLAKTTGDPVSPGSGHMVFTMRDQPFSAMWSVSFSTTHAGIFIACTWTSAGKAKKTRIPKDAQNHQGPRSKGARFLTQSEIILIGAGSFVSDLSAVPADVCPALGL